MPSVEFIRSTILTGVPAKHLNVKVPDELYVDGLPKTFSPS